MPVFNHRLFRFLAVGVLNSLFGYSCYALFMYLIGLTPPIALFLATVIGVLFNFKTTGYLVFKSNDNRLLFRFIFTYAIVYTVNILLIEGFGNFGVNAYYSGAILIFPMAVLAYILNTRFVFNHG
jgi:putative flippase GtrA